MTKRFTSPSAVLLTVAGLVLALVSWLGVPPTPADAVPASATVSTATAPAPDTVQSCSSQPTGCYWYTTYRMRSNSICFQNNVGVFWNYLSAESGFQSGSNTVLFFNHGAGPGSVAAPCSDNWAADQIMTFTTENVASASCYHVSWTDDVGGIYTGGLTVRMNLSSQSAACRADTQIQNNSVSNAIGVALGLAYFTSSTNLTSAVMNRWFRNSYNFPGSDDRNALYWLY